ncbi:uncharacterized protein LOC130193651 isoform X6 [Pseudoliparis swirei]|uniref:uncharacterized protein LOC130193651 isoform X6 n=1 Tax=Pseudoliparis swirei TaxID=2059687 RepID=UPI0024BDEA73|nr:uncharacterized protein LOC130193651 isoform X6 [Pseudoliparis swirei]
MFDLNHRIIPKTSPTDGRRSAAATRGQPHGPGRHRASQEETNGADGKPGDPAAQTEHSEGDPRHAEGSAAVYGAGPLPVPLPPSVQSHALTTSLGMTTPLHRSHINLN